MRTSKENCIFRSLEYSHCRYNESIEICYGREKLTGEKELPEGCPFKDGGSVEVYLGY